MAEDQDAAWESFQVQGFLLESPHWERGEKSYLPHTVASTRQVNLIYF